MDKLRKSLSGASGFSENDSESGSILTDVQGDTTCGSLSWETRLKGFVACFVLGVLLSLCGSVAVFFKHFPLFGVLFTAGNITSLVSTCFLMGPVKQVKNMFAPTRLAATIIVLVMMVLTLLAGFLWHNGGLCLIFSLLQYLAMIWYSLSYIPFARDAVIKCFNSCIS